MKKISYILPFFLSTSFAAPIVSSNGGTNYNNSNAYHLQFTSNINLPADINLQNAYNNDVSKFITFFPLQGFAFKNSSGNNVEVWLEDHITEFKPVTVTGNGSDAVLMLGTEDPQSSIFQVKSSQWGSNPFPYMTTAQKNAINLTTAKPGWGVFDTDEKSINVYDGTETQQLLSAQHITGSGSVTVTNNGDGTVNVFGAGSSAPDAAYASFATQNNSVATVFPASNTFKPVYLGTLFSVDQATDFTNQFLTIDSVSTPVMTYTGATTQEFDIHESFSIRGAVATTATFKFCIAIRAANGTVSVTDYCQLATASNLIDFIPGPKLVGSVELSTGDSVFAEAQNITNTNSIYVAFSNYLSSSVAGSIPDTNGLPQGTNNKYLTTDGGTNLASATGTINNGHLAQFSGTSGLVADSGVALSDLGLQYFYDNNPDFPYQELVLDDTSGELDISAGASSLNISTTGVHVQGSLSENNTLGYFRVGPYSIDPASTMFSIECYPSPINTPCGALPYPHLSSALEALIPTGSAPLGLGIYNSDTKTIDLWNGSGFAKFLSSDQYSGDITVNTSGAATVANNAITPAKIAALGVYSVVTTDGSGKLATNPAAVAPIFYGLGVNNGGAPLAGNGVPFTFGSAMQYGNYMQFGGFGPYLGVDSDANGLWISGNLVMNAPTSGFSYANTAGSGMIRVDQLGVRIQHAVPGTVLNPATLVTDLSVNTSGDINLPHATASEMLATDSSKHIISVHTSAFTAFATVTGSTQSISPGTMYFNNYTSGQAVFTLPNAPALNTVVSVVGLNTASTSGWIINAQGSDKIQFASSLSAAAGSVASTVGSATDSITLIYAATNLWVVMTAVGLNFTVT